MAKSKFHIIWRKPAVRRRPTEASLRSAVESCAISSLPHTISKASTRGIKALFLGEVADLNFVVEFNTVPESILYVSGS